MCSQLRRTDPPGSSYQSIVLLLLTIFCLVGSVVSERISIGEGFGWDGQFHREIAKEPFKLLHGLNSYQLQRIGPGMAVHLWLVLSGSAPSDAAVLNGFLLLNSVTLLGVTLLWFRVCSLLALGRNAALLGLAGMLANVSALKMAFYYPTLTDTAALGLGMLMTFLFLTGQRLALTLSCLLGSFTWPLVGPLGAFLILFPCARPDITPHESRGPLRPALPKIVATVVSLAVASGVLYLYYHLGWRTAGMSPDGLIRPVVEPLFYLSLTVTCAYCYLVISSLLSPRTLCVPRTGFWSLSKVNVALSLVVILIPKLAVQALSIGEPTLTLSGFLGNVFFLSATRPGIFVVAHVVYFGPVLLVVPFFWTRFCENLHRWGVGAVLFMLASLLVAAGPETRQSVLCLPMLMTALALAIQESGNATSRLTLCFIPLALLTSRFWQAFNDSPPLLGSSISPGEMPSYFAVLGPWMSDVDYIAGLAQVCIGLIVVRWALKAPLNAVAGVGAEAPTTFPHR